jgi:ferric iron reductase protein FhuF
MIAEVAAQVPDTLAAYRDGIAEGPGGPEALPLGALRDPDVFDATLAAFGAGFGVAFRTADPRVRVSYWSQFYLAALATPALTALVRLGRPLPLAFDAGQPRARRGRPAVPLPPARGRVRLRGLPGARPDRAGGGASAPVRRALPRPVRDRAPCPLGAMPR